MSWKPNTPWQTCTHPLDARKELPHLDNGDGTVLVQYDCLNCGSMLSVDMDRRGNVIKQWDWVPPEDDDGPFRFSVKKENVVVRDSNSLPKD